MGLTWIKWGNIEGDLRDLLDDINQTDFTSRQLRLWANWALDDLTRIRPKYVTRDYEANVTEIAIPDDFFAPHVIRFPNAHFIEEIVIRPGTQWYSEGEVTAASTPNAWWRDDENIYFLRKPTDPISLYYYAFYAHFENDDTSVHCPRWFERAIHYFVASHGLRKGSINEANINRWNTRRDQGKPTDNPLAMEADRFMTLYFNLVSQEANVENESVPIWRPGMRNV